MTYKRYDEILNWILRHPAYDPDDFLIIYKHRGTPQGLKALRVSRVAHVSRRTVILRDNTQIPCHRIVQIRNHHTGEILAGKELGLDEEILVEARSKSREEKLTEVAKPLEAQGVTVAVRASYPEEGEYSWEEALLPFAEVGSVEIAFQKTHIFLERVEIRDVIAPFSKLPLKASSAHMPHAKLTKPEVFAAAVEKTLRITKALGCPLIIAHPSYGSFKGRLQEIEAFLAQRIDPLLERAGVLLCWETFAGKRRFLSGIEEITAFCRGREHHAACYDTSHLLKPQAEAKPMLT